MDKARAAVSDFMAKAGHHDTTVHETVAPAVTHETIKPQRHEEIVTAVDKEIHQDHYHTSVQPVVDRKILPEQHSHNVVPVETREFRHGNEHEVKSRLAETAAAFKDQQTIAPARETRSTAPVVAGEHIHHHVHETIQPIVQRETIQPHVVHTTVPIHEVHHNAAQHHSTSALPAVSLEDFKKQGGVLTGREERYDGFEGEPRAIGGALGGHHGHHAGAGVGVAGAGVAGAAAMKHRHRSDSSSSSSDEETGKHRRHRNKGLTGTTGTGLTGSNTTGSTGSTGTKSGGGLMAKLDPRVDSNGDGKAGFMK